MPGPDWAYYLGAALSGLTALALLWWSLFADRRGGRGRRRCPKCWYDMTGAPSLKCPECGYETSSERRLLRTRRRWRWVFFGLALLALSAASWATPSVRRDGWWSLAPTWVVIGMETVLGRQTWESLSVERSWRLRQGDFASWQLRALVDREPEIIRMRAIWPHGAEIRAAWQSDPGFGEIDLRVEPMRVVGAPRAWRYDDPESWHVVWEDMTDVVATDKRGEWVEFRLTTVSVPLPGVVLRRPVRRVATLDEAITPVSGEWIDMAVKQWMQPRILDYGDGEPLLMISRITPVQVADQQPSILGISVGLRIEFRLDDQVMAEARWWQRPSDLNPFHTNLNFHPGPTVLITGRPELVRHADPRNPRWTVRVVGDGEMALRDLSGTKYWKGEFTLPLKALYDER